MSRESTSTAAMNVQPIPNPASLPRLIFALIPAPGQNLVLAPADHSAHDIPHAGQRHGTPTARPRRRPLTYVGPRTHLEVMSWPQKGGI